MKKRFCFMVLAVSLLLSGWCMAASAENGWTVEAENGTLLGGAVVKQSPSPSMSWMEGLQKTGDGVSVSITVPESAFFEDQRMEYVYLDAGEHEIAVKHF